VRYLFLAAVVLMSLAILYRTPLLESLTSVVVAVLAAWLLVRLSVATFRRVRVILFASPDDVAELLSRRR